MLQPLNRTEPQTASWPVVRRWRRKTRSRLTSRRLAVSRATKERARSHVSALIVEQVRALGSGAIGFYWPIRGEIDLRHLVEPCIDQEASAALPVVVAKGQPLEFWRWTPGTRLRPGVWNIPVPERRQVVRPRLLVVPLLGFDGAGFRLGYGGGYYDRTLAAMTPKPLTVAVGYESGRLPTIFPQPHDIPMDAIVTERGLEWFRPPVAS